MNYSINIFSDKFMKAKNRKDEVADEQISRNSQGTSQEELMLIDAQNSLYSNNYYQPAGNFTVNQAQAFRSIFSNKFQKISIYREMSFFPEIVDALNMICNEAITADDKGNFVKLRIKKDLPAREEKHIRKVFDYIVSEVLKFDERGWKMFRTWLVESELFVEKIMNDEGTRIIGIKILPATNTYPIYDGNVIKKFVQTTKRQTYNDVRNTTSETTFESNQVCYIHYDDYVLSKMDVRGYLEPAIRTWSQYKNLQDSLIIYRLVRAPTRRLWNVETGRLPPGKAEEFLKQLIAKYKKNYDYNPEKGNIDSSKLFQSLTDDYWFIKREGQGTTVDNLESSMNIGSLDDINMFKTSLYKSLQIPKSRWEDNINSVTTIGAPGELTRDELDFSKFVGRLRNRFKKLFLDLLCTQLELSNQVDAKFRRESLFDVEYCEENLFAEQKKLMNIKSKYEVLSMATADMASKDNPNGLWSRRYLMREIYGMNEEEYLKLQNEIQEELSEQTAKESDENVPGPGDEEEETQEPTPEISQTQNQANQEKNAEQETAPETPEGSNEQIPGEESGTNQIQLP